MRAIRFHRIGDPLEVLAIDHDAPEPTPASGEVLLEPAARPIHPSDLAFIHGTYRLRPALPQVAGLSGAGRVVGTGRRVAFRWPGAWAERVAVPAHRLVELPDDISDEDGAQLPLNPVTAWALLDVVGTRAGMRIALTAPGSNVAKLVTALAAEREAQVVPIESLEQVEAAARDGLDAALDAVGGPLAGALLEALRPGAVAVAYGVSDARPAPVTNATLIYRNLTWCGFGIDRWLEAQDDAARARMWSALIAGVRGGKLALPVRARFALERVHDALRVADAPGKVLLVTPAAAPSSW